MKKWHEAADGSAPDPRISDWFAAPQEQSSSDEFVAGVLRTLYQRRRRARAVLAIVVTPGVILLWLLFPVIVQFSLRVADLSNIAIEQLDGVLASPLAWLPITGILAAAATLLRLRSRG